MKLDHYLLVKNLEAHEEEIRKQERQKVIAELEEWVNKNTVDFVSEDGYFTAIEPDDLKQKLKEMKEA